MPKLLISEANGINLITEQQEPLICSECNDFLHKMDEELLSEKKPGVNFSQSPDGFQVASGRFKDALEEFSESELVFRPLASGYYAFWPKRTVFIDMKSVTPKFGRRCKTCGKTKSLHASENPKNFSLVPNETKMGEWDIVRSAQEFGGPKSRFFLIFVGDMLAEKLKGLRLTGVVILDVNF